jgi:hypothetical protein
MISRNLRQGMWLCIATLSVFAVASPERLSARSNSPQNVANALAALQRDDARLQSIGWRLSADNAQFCVEAQPAIGLLLQDMTAYGNPQAMRTATGISGDIAVQAVAGDSPAAHSGLLANEEVLALADTDIAALTAGQIGKDPASARLARIYALIDRILARDGQISMRLRAADGQERSITIAGQPVCPSQFELRTDSSNAQADGKRIMIGRHFAAPTRSSDKLEDGEFAAVIAHEMAHNLLGHGNWLRSAGRSWDNIRISEREADRLCIWLLANAGYDPSFGPRLMRGWGHRDDRGLERVPSHQAWDDRAALMEQEISALRAVLARTSAADWSQNFRRELHFHPDPRSLPSNPQLNAQNPLTQTVKSAKE